MLCCFHCVWPQLDQRASENQRFENVKNHLYEQSSILPHTEMHRNSMRGSILAILHFHHKQTNNTFCVKLCKSSVKQRLAVCRSRPIPAQSFFKWAQTALPSLKLSLRCFKTHTLPLINIQCSLSDTLSLLCALRQSTDVSTALITLS